MKLRRILNLTLALALLLSFAVPAMKPSDRASAEGLAAPNPRYFAQTGFAVGSDAFWDYFQKRGGVRTFGYPTSRVFTLLGKQVQFFQRRIIELRADGSVGQLNLLDPDVMPYNTINYATLPAFDPSVANAAPTVGSGNYAQALLPSVQSLAPDMWNGLAVNFYQTFLNTVSMGEAFPAGGGSGGLMWGIDFEMWGSVTSKPQADPNNNNFVYLRWQRGIEHFDNSTGLTQGLLLGDAFKAVITGQNLPGDLDQEARGSRYYKQYNNALPNGVARPGDLPNTNMKDAFEQQPDLAQQQLPPPSGTSGMRYGMQAHMVSGQNQQLVLDRVTGAGFGWVKQQVEWAGIEPSPGNRQWGALDSVANNAVARNVNVLFSIVKAPSWAAISGTAYPKNPQDLANFMSAMAAHFKGRVQAYEVWNEENFAREVGPGNINAGNYVELLKATYPAIKGADPNAIVVSGAPTPTGVNDPNVAFRDITYLQQMYQYQGGVVKNYFDALGAHNEPYWNPPDQTVATATNGAYANDPSFFFRQVEDYRNLMVQMGDGNKQIWETEIGYDANPMAPAGYNGWTVSDQQQATYLVQLFQYARAHYPWMGAIFVWNLNFQAVVPQTDEKWGFGILNPDYSPRPAYAGLRDMPK